MISFIKIYPFLQHTHLTIRGFAVTLTFDLWPFDLKT